MKNKGLIIFVIVLLAICVILLSGILYLGLTNNKVFKGMFKNNNVSNEKILEKEYDEEFSYIDIKTSVANVEIKRGDKYKLVIYGENELLSLNEDDGLSINYSARSCYFFCFGIESARIVLYLPEEYDKEIKIENNFGNVELDDFEYSSVTIDSDCGDIKTGEVKNATIKNNYGDINVKKINNKAEIKADCGDIEIKEVDLKENSTIENNFGDIKIDRTNDILIESKVSLGDNKVRNNNYKSDIILKITNDCGDIRVN